MARNDDLGRPAAGENAEEPEFYRQKARVVGYPVYIGVDSPDESGDDLLAVGMIRSELLLEVSTESQEPRPDIPQQRFLPQDLGGGPRGLAPPHLQLKKPVRGDIKALGEKEVMLVPGVDVGNPPLVLNDFHRVTQAFEFELGLCGSGLPRAKSQDDTEYRPQNEEPLTCFLSHETVLPSLKHLIANHPPCHQCSEAA